MDYPEDFIKRCEEIYPDYYELHTALETGSYIAGRFLCDSCQDGFSFDMILSANSLEDLQTFAKKEVEKQNLYRAWSSIIDYLYFANGRYEDYRRFLKNDI